MSENPPTNKRPVMCAVACDALLYIVDDRDDALQCEGDCQKWLHQICMGVSKSHHNALSNSPHLLRAGSVLTHFNKQQLVNCTRR